MKIVILGAGRSGRGFVARLLHGQAQLTFIDRNERLIERLNAAGEYTVRYFDGALETVIAGYTAYHVDDAACKAVLSECNAVFVSVRGENGPAAGAWLEKCVGTGRCVVACENATMPASLLGGNLADTAASGAIFCTTVEDGEIDILSESYPTLHVSSHGMNDEIAALNGITVERDFDTLMLRKIYTYNAASGIIAYLGADRGMADYAEAANDPAIARELDTFYAEVNQAIVAEYGIESEAQARFADFSKAKFQNRVISDSVARNAASPERKLSGGERIIAPAKLIRKHGGSAIPLVKTAAAALRYLNVDTEEQAHEILMNISGLEKSDSLLIDILEAFGGKRERYARDERSH